MFGGVLALGVLVTVGVTDPIDQLLLGMLRAEAVRQPLAILRPLTQAGSTWAVTAIAIALLVGLILRRRPWQGILAGGLVLGASIVNTVAKSALARARPDLF
jgi:uncharacterized membrane protein HdeD (DUF308 family)